MFKKLTILLAITAVALLVIKLNFSSTNLTTLEQSPPPPNLTNTVNTTIIAYTGSSPYHSFWAKLQEGVIEEGRNQGLVIVDYSQGDFSAERQIINIQEAIKDNVAGIIVGAESSQLDESFTLLKKAGIPLVTVNVDTKHPWVSSHIGVDAVETPAVAARYIRDKLINQKEGISGKKIIILTGDEKHANARERANIASKILTECGYDVTTHYSVGWSGSLSLQALLKDFSEYGNDIIAVFATFAPASVAIVEASEEYKYTPLLVGFDLSETMRAMIKNDRLNATVTQNPKMIGTKAVQAIAKIIHGKKVPKQINIKGSLINASNLDQY